MSALSNSSRSFTIFFSLAKTFTILFSLTRSLTFFCFFTKERTEPFFPCPKARITKKSLSKKQNKISSLLLHGVVVVQLYKRLAENEMWMCVSQAKPLSVLHICASTPTRRWLTPPPYEFDGWANETVGPVSV